MHFVRVYSIINEIIIKKYCMTESNNSSNNIETDNSIKKNQWDLKTKFLSWVINEGLWWDNKNEFLEDIMKNDSIISSSLLEKSMKKFKSLNDEFKDFDITSLSIFDFKRGVAKEYNKLTSTKQNYLEHTFSWYDLDHKQRKKLEKSIQKMWTRDLDNLMNSDKNNLHFLDNIFWEWKIHKNASFPILWNVSKQEINTRLQKLSQEDRKTVEETLYNASFFNIKNHDIKDLFATNFLNISEKKEIINRFIPYITLWEAVGLGLIDKKDAEKKKKQILSTLLKNELSWDILEEALSSSSINDIKIKSEDLLSSDEDYNIVAEWIGFSKLEEELNEVKKDIKKGINENWPQDIEELRHILSWEDFRWVFNKIPQFIEWNIIKITKKEADWNTKISYGSIDRINNQDKTIEIRWIWWNSSWEEIFNVNVQSKPETFSFVEFMDNFKEEGKQACFYTHPELKELIDDPKNNIVDSDLNQYTVDDLKENPSLADTFRTQHFKQLEEERAVLEEDITRLESEISTLENSADNKNTQRVKNLKIQLKNYKQRLDSSEINYNASPTTTELLYSANKAELIDKINRLDSEWKNIISTDGRRWLFSWMYISSKLWIHKITGLDWETWKIHLEHKGKNGTIPEIITFEDFYQSFKKNNGERLQPLSSLEDLVSDNQVHSEKNNIWDDYEVKDWKLQIKKIPSYSKNKDQWVDFLVSSDSDSIFKIESIDWENITFTEGERKDINKIKDPKEQKKYKDNVKLWDDWKPETKDWKIQYEWELLRLNTETTTMSLVAFNKLINQSKEEFYPDWQTGKWKTISNPQDSKNNFHASFWTKLFNNFSISELIMWGKLLVENFEEYLKKWNDIHSAEFALKMWKFLPEEVKAELRIKVEREEEESTDKEIEALGKVDSPIATNRIKWWLLNKDTPEYKKEAAMLFMVKKYGHLNAKELTDFAWKFLWYEAFWWKIWDALFLDLQQEAKDKDQTFTEEFLLYMLVKKQCKPWWYKWVHRRSRLHKTFKSSWPEDGIKGELETWYNDASDERTAKAMVEWGINEMKGWTISNAVWWFKKAIERWWSIEDMSEWFFTLLYSWAIYNVDQKTYLHIKSLWDWEKMPMIMARFSSFKSDMHLFNETVLELSKRIGDEYQDEFPNIKKEAQSLFNDANDLKWSDVDRMKRAQAFWNQYWTPLSNALNMKHTANPNYSKTDKILILEKDTNPTFAQYFEKTREFTTEWTFWKDFMQDAMWIEWIAGLNTNYVLKEYAQLHHWWTIKEWNWEVVDKIWEGISADINSVQNGNYTWGEDSKRKYLDFIMRDIIWAFIANNGWEDSHVAFYTKKSPFKDDMHKWWITEDIMHQFNKYSEKTILSSTDEWVKKLINTIIDTILSWGNSDNTWENSFESWLSHKTQEETEDIKNKVDKNI